MGILTSWRGHRSPRREPISDRVWRRVVEDRPLFDGLSADEIARLRVLSTDLLAQKDIHGAAGQEIDNRVRATIAAQACLPILNLGIDYYKGWVEVIVYPDQFLPEREEVDAAGVVHITRRPLSGEAWHGGPVILSWADVQYVDHGGGVNVVIHEFAHKLDMLDGDVNGMPPLHKEMSRRQWSDAFWREYSDFCAALESGRPTTVDPYAAESPGEFFAVMSEAFFEIPAAVKLEHPQVYRQLQLFYRQDPALRRPQAGDRQNFSAP